MLERFASLGCLLIVTPLVFGCGSAAASTKPNTPTPAVSTPAGQDEHGRASYYSDRLAGRSTASGQPYEPTELTAAHRTLPFGTIVRVRRVSNGKTVEVRINDRGPHAKGRIVDLSRRAAEAIDMVRDGVADVVLTVVSMPPAKKKMKR